MPWFMQQIKRGFFEVTNPFNRRVSRVPASPDRVHTIVFWSKNYGLFLDNSYGEQLLYHGYHLFFNFTINSKCNSLEPNVPPLIKRLDQLEQMCRRFGADTIQWRFDPLCFFRTDTGPLQNNMHDFASIAVKAAECGINRCITSFMDHYPKIRKRLSSRPGFEFIDPPLEKKLDILTRLEAELAFGNTQLSVCCEKELMAFLPRQSTITRSACIPGALIQQLFGGRISQKKDAGQRIKAGCGCTVSSDIGSYYQQPCYHNCLFCYANPKSIKNVNKEINCKSVH